MRQVALLLLMVSFLQILPPVPGRTFQNDARGPNKINQKTQGDQNVAAPSSVQNIESPNDTQGNTDEKAQVGKQEHIVVDPPLPAKDSWDKAYVVATFLLVAIGAITFAAIWYQSYQTKVAAVAAKASADALINIERAWMLTVVQVEQRHFGGEGNPVGMMIVPPTSDTAESVFLALVVDSTNNGKGPGWITEVCIGFECVDTLPDHNPIRERSDKKIAVHKAIPSNSNWPCPVTVKAAGRWNGLGKTWIVYGAVKYRDVFGFERTTEFGYGVVPGPVLCEMPEYSRHT